VCKWLRVIAKTWVAAARMASETGRLPNWSNSAPRFLSKLAVSMLHGAPLDAATPAELTS
jgi:hypothetical protein